MDALAYALVAVGGAMGRRFPASSDARTFVMVGLCGGFTTFSFFSLRTLDLARDGWPGQALLSNNQGPSRREMAVYAPLSTAQTPPPAAGEDNRTNAPRMALVSRQERIAKMPGVIVVTSLGAGEGREEQAARSCLPLLHHADRIVVLCGNDERDSRWHAPLANHGVARHATLVVRQDRPPESAILEAAHRGGANLLVIAASGPSAGAALIRFVQGDHG